MAVSGWSPTRLGDVVEIKHGWPFKSEYFHEDLTDHPIVVSVGNFRYTGGFRFAETAVKEYRDSYPKEYELVPGDILLIMTCQTAGGEILGIPARIPSDSRVYLHNQRLGKVVIRKDANVKPEFLYWLFLWQDFNRELVTSASGTKILHTAPSRIETFRFDLPPKDEQRAIAHILGTLADKIELNRRMNETLEAMARALFKSWFVDFDPVRAKMVGAKNFSPLRKHIFDLFSDSFEDSELGEIPKGWEVRRWGDLVTLEYGKSLSGYSEYNAMYPVYGTNGRIGSHSEPLCKHAGIIIGRKGAYRGVHFCNEPFFVIDTAFYVEPKKPVDLRWAYYELLRQDINSMDSGSAIPSTSRKDFYSLQVLAPPFEVQHAFSQLLHPVWARQEQSDKESCTLALLRDTLLPKLVSGELRVKDAEQVIGDISDVF